MSTTFVKLTESCYIKKQDRDSIEYVVIAEYDTENDTEEDNKETVYETSIHFFTNDNEKNPILSILPIVPKPDQLYELVDSIGHELDMTKIAPGLYINKKLYVKAISIEEYCGDFPKRSTKHVIQFILSNGNHVLLGSYNDYTTACNFLTNQVLLI